MQTESIDTTVRGSVPYPEVARQYDVLRLELEEHCVPKNNRTYIGADHDFLAPKLLGGSWTLVDDYSEECRCPVSLADIILQDDTITAGTRIASVGPHPNTMKKVFAPTLQPSLVFFRERNLAYVQQVAEALLASAPYVLTDMHTLQGYHRVAESITIAKEKEPLSTLAFTSGGVPLKIPVSAQLFLYAKK